MMRLLAILFKNFKKTLTRGFQLDDLFRFRIVNLVGLARLMMISVEKKKKGITDYTGAAVGLPPNPGILGRDGRLGMSLEKRLANCCAGN